MPTWGLEGRVEVPSSWFASSQWACSMAWSRSTSSARCSSSCWFPLCSSRTRACSRASLKKRQERWCRAFEKSETWQIREAKTECQIVKVLKGAKANVEDRSMEWAALHHSQFGLYAQERDWGLKGILQELVPELIILSHLLLPFLSFCHFHLELSQLSGQFLLVLSI